MHIKKNKKILIYFFLLFFVGSINNLNFDKYNFSEIKKINVFGLSDLENQSIIKNINNIKLDNGLILSSNFSTIKEIALGSGPSKSILALGYTGWSSFQLHTELRKNDWFELNLDTDIIFAKNHRKKWDQAISKLGINKELLQNAIFSNYSGSA